MSYRESTHNRNVLIKLEIEMKYQASCHCGNVSFVFDSEIKEALSCNCSICERRGSLLIFIPRSELQLLTPEEAAVTYTFNKHTIKHRFCSTCGIHPYGEGLDPQGNAVAAINIRCVEGLDVAAIPVQYFDGKSA
ncbi:GFA family protein [Paraglaciecola hydrolytica]|nr:GFA family protein [Paraglaciecola hydrolytica]